MFRRDLGLFAKCLKSALISFAVIVLICAAAIFALIAAGEKAYAEPVVALVDNEDSLMSGFVIDIVMDVDYIAETLNISVMSEEDAMKSLYEGECAAVMILPAGFTDDVLSGRENKGKIIIPQGLSAQSEIVCEIARFGETLLLAGQYGVFSGQRLISKYALWDEYENYLTVSNIKLLGEAFGAGQKYFEIETTGYSDTGMSSSAYSSLCWITALLFFISIFFGAMFNADLNRSMLSRLYASGISGAEFMLHKLTLTFMFRLIICGVALAAVHFSGIADVSSAVIPAIAVSAYVSVVGACLAVCFGDGITPHAVVTVMGLILCGGIVPRQMLPRYLTLIGDITPYGGAKAMLAPAFGGDIHIAGVIAAVTYTLVAVYAVHCKLKNTVAGRGAL